MSRVATPLQISTQGAMTLRMADVDLVAGRADASCP
jgi:hypothetical protein